jgi:hypothetical protein
LILFELALAFGAFGAGLAAFLESLQLFFPALGAIGGAANQFAAHQLKLAGFGTIALTEANANDAGITAVALTEPRPELIEELLYAFRRLKKARGLTARMKSTFLGESDHFLDEGLGGLGLGDRGLDAFIHHHAGNEVAEQGPARADVTLEFESASTVSHFLSSFLKQFD